MDLIPLPPSRLVSIRLTSRITAVDALPASGQPLLNLRSIIIEAHSIKATFPAKLPALKQLVIISQGHLEVDFEDPLATALGLTSFYVLGKPPVFEAVELLGMSASLTSESLTLDVALPVGVYSRSCIYLRHIDAKQTLLEQLTGLVRHLATDCRCGACNECLRREGCTYFV